MSVRDLVASEMQKWDPEFTERLAKKAGPFLEKYFRFEVHGMDHVPPAGGALMVSNHSGGTLTPDVLILGVAYYSRFGYDRPLFTLGHDCIFVGKLGSMLTRLGVIHANRENAARALRSDGVVLVFPGGDYDAYRPSTVANVIDFNGRTGYVRTALESGVPIVPTVSIGAQDSQLFLTRGTGLAKRLGLKRLRVDILPITVGFPFGVSMFVLPNLPLPSKIVTTVLEPIDIVAQFGPDPDVDEVDAHVRAVMQDALDNLARKRRLPILG